MHARRALPLSLRVLLIGLSPAPAVAQWSEQKFLAPDAEAGDFYGSAVELSGDTVVVGAMFDVPGGTVRVLGRDQGGPGAWGEVKTLAPDVGGFVWFGWATALSGDLLAVSSQEGVGGAVYLFERDAGGPANWGQIGKGIHPSSSPGEQSVDVDGDTAVSGTPYEGGAVFSVGAAHIFERDLGGPNAWGHSKTLAPGEIGNFFFGTAVAIEGDTLAVGARSMGGSGRVVVYGRNVGGAGAWGFQQMLVNSNPLPAERFGVALDLVGDTLLVGASSGNYGGVKSGTAHVFYRVGGAWIEQAELAPQGGAQWDGFGTSVALSPDGGTAVIGAPDAGFAAPRAGAVYVFERDLGGPDAWGEVVRLLASDPDPLDNLGWSVAIDGDELLAGAYADDEGGAEAGAAYLFSAPAGFENYCTAGTSASGCTALVSASGAPSASAASGFVLSAGAVQGAVNGLFYFGTQGRQANPWGNGTSYQCVVPPVVRAGLLAGSGSSGQCDGTFAQDLNALWCPTCPKPAKNPGAGATVQAQLWYRDPLNTSNQTTSLSDAIEFVLSP